MSTYREKIINTITANSNINEDWVQFIKDHYLYIIRNSSRTIVSPDDRVTYRFRLREYLHERCSLDIELLWVVMWLNDWEQELDFNDVASIILPSVTTINYLYSTYLTASRNLTTKTGLDSWQ